MPEKNPDIRSPVASYETHRNRTHLYYIRNSNNCQGIFFILNVILANFKFLGVSYFALSML